MRELTRILVLLALSLGALLASGQAPASVDLSFNPNDLGYGTGDGSLFAVKTSARQADGRTLIGGQFTTMNGYARGYMARLEPNGMLDLAFVPAFNAEVSSILVQVDGKILVGGTFTSYAGSPCPALVRLEPDGSLAFGMGFDEAREGDMPLEIEGVPLLIAQPSQALLDDAMLDYVEVAPGRLDFVCVAQTPDEETPAPAPAGGCGSGGCNRCGG